MAAVTGLTTEAVDEAASEPVKTPSLHEAPRHAAEPAVEPARIALLTEHLDRASQLAALEPYLPAIGGTLCAAGTVALAAADTNEFHGSRVALLLPTTLCAAASFGSYLLPREYQGRVTMAAVLTSGSALIAVDALTFPDISPAQRLSVLGFASAGVGISALGLMDVALERPVSWTTLANDDEELHTSGTTLSRTDVRRIESDYRHYAVRPIPSWAYGAMQLLSGAVSAAPLFVPSTSHDDKIFAAAMGAMNAIPGALNLGMALMTENRYDRYEKGLRNVRLSPVGPRGAAGLWATGTF